MPIERHAVAQPAGVRRGAQEQEHVADRHLFARLNFFEPAWPAKVLAASTGAVVRLVCLDPQRMKTVPDWSNRMWP